MLTEKNEQTQNHQYEEWNALDPTDIKKDSNRSLKTTLTFINLAA